MSDKYEQMMVKFPNLYGDRHKSMMETCMCWGCECGEGWYDLLYELSEKLENLILEMPEEERERFRASQVKEKFGLLRVYMSSETDEMSKLIEEAENKSETICEQCGKPGKLYTQGWCIVQCPECRLERVHKYYKSRLELLIREGLVITAEKWDELKNKED